MILMYLQSVCVDSSPLAERLGLPQEDSTYLPDEFSIHGITALEHTGVDGHDGMQLEVLCWATEKVDLPKSGPIYKSEAKKIVNALI